MKTSLTFPSSCLAVCLAATLASRSFDVYAQPPAAPPATEPTPLPPGYRRNPAQPAPTSPQAATPTASKGGYVIEIKDGLFTSKWSKTPDASMLRQLADTLREAHPEANLVVAPAVANVVISDLKLRATSLEDELEALSVASGGQFIWERRVPTGGLGVPGPAIDPATGLQGGIPGLAVYYAPPAGESTLYVLREPMAPVELRRRVEAFNLTGYLQSFGKTAEEGLKEIEKIKMIIADTFEDVAGDRAAQNRPVFKFHSGSNLLIVIGPDAAIEIARQVVNALPGQERRYNLGSPGEYPPGVEMNNPYGGGPPPQRTLRSPPTPRR